MFAHCFGAMLKRWPFLMGSGCTSSPIQPPSTATPSAFKSLSTSAANSLPPISSLREREGATISTHNHPHHHSHHPGHYAGPDSRARNILGQNSSLQQDVKVCGLSPSFGAPGLSGPSLAGPGLGLANVSSPSHPTPHPAFPIPLTSLVQAPPTDGLNPLQHLMSGNKALTLTHYLTDPLAKAALLDLGRYGHYPLGKKLFGCPQCRYVTDRKNNLKRHVATMHQDCDKLLECCGVAFKNKASLRDHVLIFHANGYMCRFCGRNFCRKALLKRHLTVHSGQKDYVCPLCDYATSHKSNLERHKKVHERQGSDQEDADREQEIFSYAHGQTDGRGHVTTHTTSASSLATSASQSSTTPSYHVTSYRSSQPTSGSMERSKQRSDGATSTTTTVTSSTETKEAHSTDKNTNHADARQTMVTSSSSSSRSARPEVDRTVADSPSDYDVRLTSLGHAYSVDRILSAYKPEVSIASLDVELDCDDDVSEPRMSLLDDDPDDDADNEIDDDEDTHSSGLIDVVHVDLHD